jgi:uncharacterized protein with FMN-binding domain
MQAVHLLSTPTGSESVSKAVMRRCLPVFEDMAVTACSAKVDITSCFASTLRKPDVCELLNI